MTDGMKEHYKKGGAITPEDAAPTFLDSVDKLEFKHSGEFWAPNGPKSVSFLALGPRGRILKLTEPTSAQQGDRERRGRARQGPAYPAAGALVVERRFNCSNERDDL